MRRGGPRPLSRQPLRPARPIRGLRRRQRGSRSSGVCSPPPGRTQLVALSMSMRPTRVVPSSTATS
eukprot:12387246-Alexandrium_andersonii.AAC.1